MRGGAALVAVTAFAATAWADPAPEPPRLTGVIVAGPVRQAIFADPGAGSILAGEGDRIGPFTVRTIRPGLVELLGTGSRYRLQPSPDGAVRAAVLVTPAPLVIDPSRREAETENDQ